MHDGGRDLSLPARAGYAGTLSRWCDVLDRMEALINMTVMVGLMPLLGTRYPLSARVGSTLISPCARSVYVDISRQVARVQDGKK